MKETNTHVFIAGATGTLGMPLVRRLVASGYRVTGLTRRESGRQALEQLGAAAVIGDALDRDGLRELILNAAPSHVIHLLTAIPKAGVMKPSDLDATNELRIRGTANLIDGAVASGARRIIAESYATAALPPAGLLRASIEAARDLERQMRNASGRIETIVLRYGSFYGPSVPTMEFMIEALRGRKMPLMRGADGVMSLIHIDDAVSATIAALDRGVSGSVYDVVDDEPVAVTEFISALAQAAGAPRPFALPRFVVKLLAPMLVEYMTTKLPLSNADAKRELGFAPRYATYRLGLGALRTADSTNFGTSSSRNVRHVRY
jgi:nucleoside-diphosphate-sugar epimerase